jgi:putative cardiolipin synthase
MFTITENSVAIANRSCLIPDVFKACLLFLLIGFMLAGCATLPTEYPRQPSTAITDYPATSLDQLFEKDAAQHPGESGFAIIRHGRQAFTARVALTDLAEKSLDLQYYIWERDETGRILAERLVRAADRGVRVRVLLDDINTESDVPIAAALDVHPNIEVRIFNPFANRGARLFDFALDLDRVNHRMHNKILVADNAVAIVGGRNIGNHYFEVATDANFRDLDIAAAGPVVRDISGVFDHFWNSDWAVPVSALLERPYTDADLQAAVRSFRERIAAEPYPYPLDQDIADLRADLTAIRDKFIWAPGQIVWDDPDEIKAGVEHGRLDRAFYRKLDTLQKEILIESAYFVARDRGVAKARELHDRGIRMRVLTNSLASNDVLAAHAGYAKYREALLANGVELYELRPDAGAIKKKVLSGKSKAALHTKAIVFDREAVFIGSFNLDPRSANLNTEAGLYVESPELAEQVIAYMDEGVRPENSYRVRLDENGHLVWETQVNGMEVRFYEDPESGFWDRFMSGFIQLLPVEHQL